MDAIVRHRMRGGVNFGRWLCGAVALVVLASVAADAAPTMLQKPPPRAKGAKKPAAATKDPTAAAANRAQAAAGEANVARGNAEAAAEAVRNAMAEQRKLEDDLVEAQSEESPLGQAKARLEKLQEERKNEMERILASPEYRSSLERLGEVGERRAEDVAKLREQMIDQNAVIASIATDLKKAAAEFQSLRKKTLEEDAD